MVGALALRWKKSYAPRLSLQRAEIQDGSAGSGEQAAHLLPGQLRVDGKLPWTLAGEDRLAAGLLARFAVTAAVPTDFNTADSAAEAAGLKDAFLLACQRSWSRVAAGERNLTGTYAEFLEDATRAFERARVAKEEKQAVASHRGATSASEGRFSESMMLRLYAVHGVTAEMANRLYPLSSFIP